MRRTIMTAGLLIIAATTWAGDRSRTFTADTPASELTEVVLRGGVGDVEILGAGGSTVEVTATATAKHSGFWGLGRASRALDEVELTSEVRGSTLYLSLELPEEDDDHEFGEEWTVRIPAELAIHLKFGVGDIQVIDVRGDVSVDVGVGDIRIDGAWDAFGPIDASCGVGDVSLRSPEGRDNGEGFISRALRSRGRGEAEIDVRAGVGDVTIKLR